MIIIIDKRIKVCYSKAMEENKASKTRETGVN
jgi:hypothetical protein